MFRQPLVTALLLIATIEAAALEYTDNSAESGWGISAG